MPIASSNILSDIAQLGDRRNITMLFVDHLGNEYQRVLSFMSADFDADAALFSMANDLEVTLAEVEAQEAVALAGAGNNPAKIPDHQTQGEFDRRVLGQIMLIDDAHTVLAAYPMFQAMELRGGANANQRAVYLGIDNATYDLIDTRFSNVNGVVWFLADEKSQIWDELPEVFQ